ncbi:hypothetical protein J6590_001479 [Homalodisca vitripennis]|nr:hypothetical protein J6590_001476 [Homalodisca vitripennis]KAG8323730.1 hypothetical protein J6590_001479 [Homalodisca vitripennis]
MVIVAVILVAVASCSLARPADEKNNGCNVKQDTFTSCFMDAGNHLFKMLSKGDKKMGLPVLDPLEVKKMKVFDNGDRMHLKLMDATHTGLGASVINKAQADPEHFKFMLNMTIPKYNIKGTYDMNAKVAMLPVMGTGDADITLEDLTVIWDVKGKPVTKKGTQFMEITDFKVDIVPKVMKMKLDNLFNGNQELGTTMNTFLNENWEDVYKQLKPSIERSFSQLMSTLGSKMLEKIPYNKMFPGM